MNLITESQLMSEGVTGYYVSRVGQKLANAYRNYNYKNIVPVLKNNKGVEKKIAKLEASGETEKASKLKTALENTTSITDKFLAALKKENELKAEYAKIKSTDKHLQSEPRKLEAIKAKLDAVSKIVIELDDKLDKAYNSMYEAIK